MHVTLHIGKNDTIAVNGYTSDKFGTFSTIVLSNITIHFHGYGTENANVLRGLGTKLLEAADKQDPPDEGYTAEDDAMHGE